MFTDSHIAACILPCHLKRREDEGPGDRALGSSVRLASVLPGGCSCGCGLCTGRGAWYRDEHLRQCVVTRGWARVFCEMAVPDSIYRAGSAFISVTCVLTLALSQTNYLEKTGCHPSIKLPSPLTWGAKRGQGSKSGATGLRGSSKVVTKVQELVSLFQTT